MANNPVPTLEPYPPAQGRSWFRRRNIVLAVVVALVGVGAYWVISIAMLKPGLPGKFTADLNQLVADAQQGTAGKPNRWDLVAQAAKLSSDIGRKHVDRPKPAGVREDVQIHNVSFPLSPEQITNPNITPEIRAELVAIIKEYETSGLLEKLDEIVASERFIRVLPPDTRTIETLLPELGGLRSIARLCKARMFLAAEAGDSKEFIRAARHTLAIGELLKKQATLIDHLVATAIDALASSCIREAIVKRQLSPETCRELLAILSGRATTYDAVRGLKAEHLQVKDTVEWTHSDDGDGDGLFIGAATIQEYASTSNSGPRTKLPPALTNFAAVVLPRKKDTLAVFDELFAATRAYAELPLRQRLNAPSPDVAIERLSKRYILPRLLMPAFGRYIEAGDNGDLTMSGTKIMLALEIHNAENGRYPSSLAEMTPSLSSMRIREMWINELRYRTFAEGEDPDGRPYLLYWIGIDNQDDKGHVDPKESSQAAWRKSNVGFDYVMNEPIERPAPPEPDPAVQPEVQEGDATTAPASEPQAAPK